MVEAAFISEVRTDTSLSEKAANRLIQLQSINKGPSGVAKVPSGARAERLRTSKEWREEGPNGTRELDLVQVLLVVVVRLSLAGA